MGRRTQSLLGSGVPEVPPNHEDLMRIVPIVLLTALPLSAQDPTPAPTPAPQGPEIVIPGVRKLTVSGQYRLRYENQIDYDFDKSKGSAASNDFFSQRVRVGLGFEFSDEVKAFFQLQDAREWGEEASTVDDMADGLDLHQGYVDIGRTPWIGGSTRIGRQEINLGDQRLVGALDWRTGGRALDGILQSWACCDDCSWVAWAVQGREAINAVNDDLWFGGVQWNRKLGAVQGEFYLMYLHDDGTAPGLSHNRFTLGTRPVWTDGPWEAGMELATQFGEQAGADIPIGDAYAAHVHVKHTFAGERRFYVMPALDLASGDDPNTADNERFHNLFPTAHAHWGMMDLAQWENLFNPWVRVGAQCCEQTDVSVTWHYFRAMEAGDAFRGPNGTLSAGNPAFSRTMGNEIDLLLTRKLDIAPAVKAALQLGYGVFLPGAGVRDANGTDDVAHFVYVQFDVKF